MENIIASGMVIIWAIVGAIIYAVLNTVKREGQ